MSEDIPLATPYPWDSSSDVEAQKDVNQTLRKRRFVGSGFAALRKSAFGSNSTMGDTAKNLLTNLLNQHQVEIGNDEDEFETEADELYANRIITLLRDANEPGTTDEEVLRSARDGKLSIFCSILKYIESSDSPVTTKSLIRHCCLTIRPGDVPGAIDAKELMLSSLHFLSSTFQPDSEEFLSLPLIRPLQEVGDLEKRTYEKAGGWTFENVQDKVLRLENAFLTSSTSLKWLKREAFCPRLPKKDEASFFLKGSIPSSASAKKPKGDGSRKRKATSQQVSTTPVIESAFDAAPVVEATIVADASPSHSIN